MDPCDDAELLRRYAADRSEDAFAELVRRHLTLVYRAALRQTNGDAHRAEDVAQLVFVQLAAKSGSLVRHPRLVGWLHTTTHLVASALLRSERRRQARESAAHYMQENALDPNSGDRWDRVRPVLDEIVRGLGRVDREAVLLHFFEGRPFADVGARLALREDAARMRVVRALEKLRRALERRGVASTTTALSLMLAQEAAQAAPPSLLAATVRLGAATAAPSAPVAGLLHLMQTSKLALSAAAGMGLLASLTGAYYTVRAAEQIARDQSATAGAEADLAQGKSRLAAATAKVTQWEQDRDRLQKIEDGLRRGARGAPGPSGTAASQAKIAQEMKALAQDPAFEAAFLAHQRANLTPNFAPLYRQQNLTPAQIQQFEAAMMKGAQANFDIAISAVQQGMLPDDPALQTLFAKTEAGLRTDLQGVVTPAQLTDYESSHFAAREVASQLKATLTYSDTPLSADQSTALSQLVAAHVTPGARQIDWEAVMAQAPAVLSPRQLTLLEAVQAKLQYEAAARAAGLPPP